MDSRSPAFAEDSFRGNDLPPATRLLAIDIATNICGETPKVVS
jgi:hypothetical protein